MSKSTLLYVFTIALMVTGLWAILAMGSRLAAPHPVDGIWLIEKEPDATGPKRLRIDQSGRFLKLRIDQQPIINLHWQEEMTLSDQSRTIRFQGEGHELKVTTPAPQPLPAGDELDQPQPQLPHRFELTGPYQAVWMAVRQ